MAAGFEAMKARIAILEKQERRLNWIIEHSVTISRFQGKFRIDTQGQSLSDWKDTATGAIDEAMENGKGKQSTRPALG